ncbi:MAG: GNAT family N-acetyltransferase [Deinococcales bacterium]
MSSAAAASPIDATPSFGCGEPTLFADLRPGERVLDLGSGAGLDVFRAAAAVGPGGRVVGVDMTPAMLARARSGARRLGIENVHFVEGLIEALPLLDESVDVILSNCVVNLSADKGAVFGEAFRVLRPGGRLAISDILRRGERTEPGTPDGWCACVDGAESPRRYRRLLRDAGFGELAVGGPPSDATRGATYSAIVRAVRPSVRCATPRDMPAILRLLDAARLPKDGLEASHVHLFVAEGARKDGLPAGVVGFELVGDAALLRSLAVRHDERGRGLGIGLIRHAQRRAQAAGARTAYALSTTIPELLVRLGFTSASRAELPAAVLASPELKGACPASAPLFTLRLR